MKNILSIFIITILLFSCDTETTNTGSTLMPDATGGADELMVFVNDAYFSESLSKDIKSIMVEPYKILPQSEARFSISTVPYTKVNTILQRFINPIYVIAKDENSAFANDLSKFFTDEDKQKLKSNKSMVLYKQNLWATDQNVAIVIVETKDSIIATLQKYKPELENYFDNANLKYYSKIAYINGVNATLNKQFKEYHNLTFDVPNGYVLAKNEKNMVLLRKDDAKSTLFLAFDIVNYSDSIPLNNLGIEKFDEVGKFIDSDKEGSFVAADSTLGYVVDKIEENGLVKYENGGLWKMQNDLVGGGPFVNQYIIDNSKNRVIYVSGMIYGPAEKHKKKYMRQFEAIFNSLKID